ncbi:MAG: hypothetical protein ABI851_07745 [Saprospiraceae bacterium]
MKKFLTLIMLFFVAVVLFSCYNLTSKEEVCHSFKASISWTEKNNQLSVSVMGGDPPYFYKWSNGVGDLSVITASGSGLYLVTVTDMGECKAYADFTIK